MTEAARTDAYLIVKRDLYYRPNAQGYTGIRDHAGRYTLAEVAVHYPNLDSANKDDVEFVHEDDAPEFTRACFHNLKAAHLMKQRDDARDQLMLARGLLDRLIKWDKDYPVNRVNGYAGLKELDKLIADAVALKPTAPEVAC